MITALLIGENSFPFHSLDEMAPEIEAALSDEVELNRTTDRDNLTDLSGYDVVVDYLTDSTLTDDQLDGLTSFVESSSYLGLHCAADLTSTSDGEGGIDPRDEPFTELRELLGGHFLDHPKQSTFNVTIMDDSHSVTEGIEDFEVFDEPYQVDCDEDDVRVLARMNHPELTDYPVVWVRDYGEGRVCYSSLGHTSEAFENEMYRRILKNAVRWLA